MFEEENQEAETVEEVEPYLDYPQQNQQNLMNIIVNSETDEDESRNTSQIDGSEQLQDSFRNHMQKSGKKNGHFRGDSFGDSIPLENTLSKKELIVVKQMSEKSQNEDEEGEFEKRQTFSRKLSKTDSLRDLAAYFSDSSREENISIFNNVKDSGKVLVEGSNNTSSSDQINDEFTEEEEDKQQFTDQQSDFAILKKLVDKFSKNHNDLVIQQHLNQKYEKYKALSNEELIQKLLNYSQKKTKLKEKVKSLQENNQALAIKLQKKKEGWNLVTQQQQKHQQERAELESLRAQQKEFRENYEELRTKFQNLQQKYDDQKLKNKKIDQRYKELKSIIQTYEEKYKKKNIDLLKEIEFLKDLVKSHISQQNQPQQIIQNQNQMININTTEMNHSVSIVEPEQIKPVTSRQASVLQSRQESVERADTQRGKGGSSYTEILDLFYSSNRSNHSTKRSQDLTQGQKISQQSDAFTRKKSQDLNKSRNANQGNGIQMQINQIQHSITVNLGSSTTPKKPITHKANQKSKSPLSHRKQQNENQAKEKGVQNVSPFLQKQNNTSKISSQKNPTSRNKYLTTSQTQQNVSKSSVNKGEQLQQILTRISKNQ